MNLRIRILHLLILFGFSILSIRLFYWQIVKGKELSIQARRQHLSEEIMDANRGGILANDGTWLATSIKAYLLYANPQKIENEKQVADMIAPYLIDENTDKQVLLEEIDRIESLLKNKELQWIALSHKMLPETKEKIDDLSIEGIGFDREEKRFYPEASTSAHLLGFVGKDDEGRDKGYFGLEGQYDIALSGKSGFLSRDSDAAGSPILLGSSKETSAYAGVDLLTFIDKAVQLSVESKLIKGIEKYGAKEGAVIVMDPKNGAVLAMSAFPSYDPSNYSEYSTDRFLNPLVSLSFEPGSVFKVVVMASALDAGSVEPDTRCNICSGPVKVDKYTIETWNQVYHPDSTMTDVIVHSDNVGMVYVGNTIGKEKLYDYLEKFGIGQLSGIDLQGEMTPKLREKEDWSNVDLATSAFGQGIAVTPIQMIRAVSAIANDGIITSPQIVNKVVSGAWEETVAKEGGVGVISKKAADEITSMMVEAAKNGEAKWTHLRGYKVAGKTGTAQIPIAGHYDEEKTIASFVGFAPSDDPKFIMLVILREPQSSPWASETAAPLWYDIAKDLFLYFGIQPEN